jgi:hypothetical protein
MHGRRALAAAAAAGLLVSLFAPWYRESIAARGLAGLETMTLTRSGWDAFSFTEGLVLVVAVVALALVAAVPGAAGHEDRGRLRLSGAIVAALGAFAFVVVLVRLSSAPGTTRDALVDTIVSLRWGIFLALGSSALLAISGLRLIRAPRSGEERAPDPAPRGDPAAWPTRRPARSGRPATRADRAPRNARSNRPPRAERPDRSPRVERPSRTERARPARGAERPRSEEEPTGWLDLPD